MRITMTVKSTLDIESAISALRKFISEKSLMMVLAMCGESALPTALTFQLVLSRTGITQLNSKNDATDSQL